VSGQDRGGVTLVEKVHVAEGFVAEVGFCLGVDGVCITR
jgi:hypothetical protein